MSDVIIRMDVFIVFYATPDLGPGFASINGANMRPCPVTQRWRSSGRRQNTHITHPHLSRELPRNTKTSEIQ